MKQKTISGVSCLWVCDKNSTDDKVILYLHGGGHTTGSVLTHRNLAADMAKVIGFPFLLINFRLLPEHKYPAPLDDVLRVYHSLISDSKFTHDNIVIGGDSTGGGLALATLVQLKNSGNSLPSRAFMLSGAFDLTLSGESMHTNSNKEPYISFEELKDWQKNYFDDLESPLLSPLFADLSDLPPILLLAGGQELWLSDSLRLTEKIKNCGGEVRLRVWDSMWHVWVMDSELKESKEAVLEICKFIYGENVTDRKMLCKRNKKVKHI